MALEVCSGSQLLLEQRWSEPPDSMTDGGAVIFTGALQKTSQLRASSSTYATRFLMLTKNHFLYSFPASYTASDPAPPLSRISLRGLDIVNNADEPEIGFALMAANDSKGERGRVKFMARNVEEKHQWVEFIAQSIKDAEQEPLTRRDTQPLMPRRTGVSSPWSGGDGVVVRHLVAPIKAGYLEKRDGTRFSSYHVRWVEVRAGVGILYGKQRDAPDESFKRIPLQDRMVGVSADKFRFSVENEVGIEIFFRADSLESFASWMAAVEQEVHPPRDRSGRRLTESEIRQLSVDNDSGSGSGGVRLSTYARHASLFFANSNHNQSFATDTSQSRDGLDADGQQLVGEEPEPLGAAEDEPELPPTLYPPLRWLPPVDMYGKTHNVVGSSYSRRTHVELADVDDVSHSVSATRTTPPPTTEGESGPTDDDDEDVRAALEWDDVTNFELQDLISHAPLHFVPDPLEASGSSPLYAGASPRSAFARLEKDAQLGPKLFPKKRLRSGVKVYLESVSMLYDPIKSSPSLDEGSGKGDDGEAPAQDESHDIDAVVLRIAPRASAEMLSRILDRMYTPFVEETYAALNEHMVLLDLDVNELRQQLTSLLDTYGAYEAIRSTVIACDDVLRQYTAVRDALGVRRNIAAFRAQKDHHGLKLGVDGTLEFVAKLVSKDRGAPSETNFRRVQQMYGHLYQCLEHFRLEFDVFDESRPTIEALEMALLRTSEWLAITEPLFAGHESSENN